MKNDCKGSDHVQFQKVSILVSGIISRHNDEYQNHIALKLNDPITNTKP